LAAGFVEIGGRYRLIEHIGEGGMGSIFRAYDRLNGQTVALKRLSATPSDLQFNTRMSFQSTSHDPLIMLATEFRILATLRHPNIISVLDYGFEDNLRPYYTMELIDGTQLLTQYGSNRDLETQVRLLIEMLQALVYLHRRGILHRDLKPGNVLVDQDGKVKVADFGLALDTDVQTLPLKGDVVGTMGYIAPEVFQGDAASVQSDLYAVGVIAYEIFSGGVPLSPDDIMALMRLNPEATMDYARVPEVLRSVVERLLEATPEARYRSAAETIRALCMAMEMPIPGEDVAMRESFLQASQFVGRAAEMERLGMCLNAVFQGVGDAWLIGGESGVGKTRLVEEIRTRALVGGALVLRAQGIDGNFLPYHLWRDIARTLCLSTAVSDVEAGILREIVPDIEALIGRRLPDKVKQNPTTGHQVMSGVISGLLRRQQRPVVMLLEDLHWLEESLIVLRYVCELVSEMPLLIIGTYRIDEQPYLSSKLPVMQVMQLKRFDGDEIRQLSIHILGRAGDKLVKLIQRETEGNALFIIEVLRALADQTGRLESIDESPLPERVFAVGINRMVQRRLKRLPIDFQTMLRVAAVFGREIDLELLRAIDSELDYDEWLASWMNVWVLEVSENRWRFTHDKIRESVLEGLDSAYVVRLHRLVAEAIETTYPAHDAYIAALANHWLQGGEVRKAALYTADSVKQLLRSGSPESGRKMASKVLDQLPEGHETQGERATLLRLLGDCSIQLGAYSQAIHYYESAIVLAEEIGDDAQRAAALSGLGSALAKRGNTAQAHDSLAAALGLYEELNTPKDHAHTLTAIAELFFDQGDLAGAEAYYQRSRQLCDTTSDLGGTIANLFGMGKIAQVQRRYDTATACFEVSLNIAEQIGNRYYIAENLLQLSHIAAVRQDFSTAKSYLERALPLQDLIGSRNGSVRVLNAMAILHKHMAAYAEAIEYAERALMMARSIEYTTGQIVALVQISRIEYMNKREQVSAYFLQEAMRIAQETRQPLYMRMGLFFSAVLAHFAGDMGNAVTWLSYVNAQDTEDDEPNYNKLRDQLDQVFGADHMQKQQKNSQALDLDAVVTQARGWLRSQT
jgi:eukaryotic-like serine/threonine-protein kinase